MSDYTKGLDVDSPWQTRRLPDAVRAAALANAVEFANADRDTWTVDAVLAVAQDFESYLAGEEADAQTDR